jgi:hypothetical protein
MTFFTVVDGGTRIIMGEIEAPSPQHAAESIYRSETRQPYEAGAVHAGGWGQSAHTSTGNGIGGEDFSGRALVYCRPLKTDPELDDLPDYVVEMIDVEKGLL